jgi:kinesin family protein 18/19
MIRDLLNPSTGILDLREDAKGVNVTGLSEVEARTTSEVFYTSSHKYMYKKMLL